MAVSFVSALVYAGTQIALGAGFIGWSAVFGLTATFAALGAVNRALIGKPDALDTMSGITNNIRASDASRKVIYGKQRVGGTIVWFETKDSCRNNMNSPYRAGLDTTRTASNEYLDMIIVLAAHEVESLEEIYLNERKIWDINRSISPWIGSTTDEKFGFAFYDGTQTAYDVDAAHASTWGVNHKLLGVSYLYCTMVLDSTVYPNGVPNISCVIKGKKVYDPRTQTTAYSENPALILYDYMRDSQFGLNESASAFDQTALTAAANVCDEALLGATENVGDFKIGRVYQITLVAGSNFTQIGASSNTVDERFVATGTGFAIGGAGQARQYTARYTCNGQIDTANPIKQNIENILSSMIGTLQYANGKFVINAYDYDATAVINNAINNDMLLEPIQISTKTSRKNLYNAVKGRFNSDINNYQVTDYPAQTSTTFATNDGETLFMDLDLPFTTNDIIAQRIARLTMLKSRQQLTVQLVCNIEALQYKVGDNIGIDNSRLGWTNKIFEINSFRLAPSAEHGLCCYITATENSALAYNWQSSDQIDFTSGGEVTIYDGMTAPTDLNASASEIDGQPAIFVSWTAAVGQGEILYKVQYSYSGVTDAQVFAYTTYDNQRSIVLPAEYVGVELDVFVTAIQESDGSTVDSATVTVTAAPVITQEDEVYIYGTIESPTATEIHSLAQSQRVNLNEGADVLYVYQDADGNTLDITPFVFESGQLTTEFIENNPVASPVPNNQVVSNYDFSTNTVWSFHYPQAVNTISISGGKLRFNNSNTLDFALQILDLVPAQRYKIEVATDSFTQGSIYVRVVDGNEATLSLAEISASGTETWTFTATTATAGLLLQAVDVGGTTTAVFDSISVTQISNDAIVSQYVYTESIPEDTAVTWTVAYTNETGTTDTGVSITTAYTGGDGQYHDGKRRIRLTGTREYDSIGSTYYTVTVTASYNVTTNIDGVDVTMSKTASYNTNVFLGVAT